MRRSEAFPSQFLGKDDLPGPVVVTIEDVQLQPIKGEHGEENKPVVRFRELDKSFIINNTNWMTVEDAYGEDSDAWKGKRVELFVDPTIQFAGKRVGGVRVRLPSGTTAKAAPAKNTSESVNGYWTLEQAVQECGKVGIDKPALIERLKTLGLSSYKADRDTKTVQMLIEEFQGASEFEDLPGAAFVTKTEETPL